MQLEALPLQVQLPAAMRYPPEQGLDPRTLAAVLFIRIQRCAHRCWRRRAGTPSRGLRLPPSLVDPREL